MIERPSVSIPGVEAIDAELAWLADRKKTLMIFRKAAEKVGKDAQSQPNLDGVEDEQEDNK